MSWTYDPAIPTTRDRVRLLLGDTDATDPLLSNEELTAFLSMDSNVYAASALAADALAGRYSRQVDYGNMSLNVSASQRAEAFRELAKQLRLRKAGAAILSAASIRGRAFEVADKQADEGDTSDVQPTFKRGMDDIPGTPRDGGSGADPRDR